MNVKLTKHALDALNAAESCARLMGHDHIGAEHIFLSILSIPTCAAVKRFQVLGYAADDMTASMKSMLGSGDNTLQRGHLPITARTQKIIEMAQREAGAEAPVGTVHLILAMLREGENVPAQMLFNAGVTVERFLSAATQSGPGEPKESAEGEPLAEDAAESEPGVTRGANGKAQKTPTVNAFGRDLTDLARQGKLDPVIGRDKELKRVIQVLSRRTKNNAVLIGEAGVGKTAVVEGLAQAIHAGAVPERMQLKRVVALDMARVVAGTQYRGQFEERLKRIVDETRTAGNIILFLDEIHTLVGAGGAEGAMDAANILKPALARGELQCIGATTLKEYHKSIEKDAALERRFQSVQVEEPNVETTVAILTGIAPRYEEHHAVRFSAASLRAAAELTTRYLPARQQPDKAIDALDETGARLRMTVSARPPELVAMQERIDTLRGRKEVAVSEGNFDLAARHREAIREASDELQAALAKWRETHVEKVLDVTEDDIAETISLMSGVPVEKMTATTAEKLLGMEKALAEAVIGQTEAIGAIARALRRSRALLGDPRRPIGSFLFLGPTGVGKTYLAKMLAERIYGDEKALVTLDMSEFQEKYAASRLVGSPPGYVGYDEGGQLTEKIRRRPYSVVLFDEFEKADGDVLNMLLQILDDGRLTDGQGRVVDFRNTIVICTANLGFDFAREGHALGFASATALSDHARLKEKLLAEAKRTFRPELLNRFDELVVFHRLEKPDMAAVLELELQRLQARLRDRHIQLSLDRKAIDFLVDKGYDPSLGARPLRRVVQDYVEDPLAEAILAGTSRPRMRAHVSKDGQKLEF